MSDVAPQDPTQTEVVSADPTSEPSASPAASTDPATGNPVVTTLPASQQGNRVKTADQLDPESPVAKLEAKVESHFGAATAAVADARAAIDSIEKLLNDLRVGF